MIKAYKGLLALFVLPAAIAGCDDYTFTEPVKTFDVTPEFAAIDDGSSVQLQAVSNGAPAAVTWSSDDPTIVSVTANGVATGRKPGRTSVIAKSSSSPTQSDNASITVVALQGVGIAKGQAVAVSGAGGSSLLYRIFVPAGTTNLLITISGGTGDVDLYVRRGLPPTGSSATDACRSFNDGNGETCSISNPQSGTWYMLLDAFTTYAGATLTATYTP